MAPGRLRTTLDRFNAGARAGRDDEHGRGSKAISRYYGDRRVRPNPNLGPVELPPFYAVRLYPGDVGSAGRLPTDRHGSAPEAKETGSAWRRERWRKCVSIAEVAISLKQK